MPSAVQNFAHALTWTLAHSLWVGASAALCLCALLCLLNSRCARWRYALGAGSLLSVPLAAAWTLSRELQGDPSEFQVLLDSSGEDGSLLWGSIGVLALWADAWRAFLSSRLEPVETWIAGGWLCMAALGCCRVVGGWCLLRFGSTYRLTRASPCVQARIARLAKRIQLRKRVELHWSENAEVPMVIGVLRPRIVIPSRLEADVETGELDLVLLHELAHVRRGDAWARTLEALLEALFVANPAISWIAARVAREREHCCDDIALAAGADRLGYVRALAALEAARSLPELERKRAPRIANVQALHATDGALVERIRRLTMLTPRKSPSVLAAACGGLFLGSTGLAVGALPTHDGRAQLASAVPLESPAEIELTTTSPAASADAPSNTGPVRVLVFSKHVDAGEGKPAGAWFTGGIGRLSIERIVVQDGATAATRNFVHFEAVKSAR
jgi:Zn-dependent protease with chaperone function